MLEQELASGALTITGDPQHLRTWWSSRIGNPEFVELEREIRAITT